MSLLHQSVEEKKFDVRVVERNVERNAISAKDWDKTVKELPDDAANADYVSLESLIADDSDAGSTH